MLHIFKNKELLLASKYARWMLRNCPRTNSTEYTEWFSNWFEYKQWRRQTKAASPSLHHFRLCFVFRFARGNSTKCLVFSGGLATQCAAFQAKWMARRRSVYNYCCKHKFQQWLMLEIRAFLKPLCKRRCRHSSFVNKQQWAQNGILSWTNHHIKAPLMLLQIMDRICCWFIVRLATPRMSNAIQAFQTSHKSALACLNIINGAKQCKEQVIFR